jgi:hypothetical protein
MERVGSLGIRRCIVGGVVYVVLKERSAFIVKGNAVQEE